MTDQDLTRAYENNLAEWWEAQVCVTDGVPDHTRGL